MNRATIWPLRGCGPSAPKRTLFRPLTLHDGSVVCLTSVPLGYDPTARRKVSAYLDRHQDQGEVLTGLLYVDESAADMHELSQTSEVPLINIPFEALCPGSKALEELQEEFR